MVLIVLVLTVVWPCLTYLEKEEKKIINILCKLNQQKAHVKYFLIKHLWS